MIAGVNTKDPDFLVQPEFTSRTAIGRKQKMEKAQL